MRMILAMLWLVVLCKMAFTQVNVSGVILDSATKEPLPVALISTTTLQVIANDQGRFLLPNLPAGIHEIFVSHIGCETRKIKVEIDQDTFITVFLPHHLHAFDEFVTYRHGNSQEPQVQLVHRLSSRKLESLAAVSLSDALQETNGVHFLRTGNAIAKPVIHGMHSNRISVINDDSKHEGQQWGSEHAPEIDPLSAGEIELIKGASTLRFGGDAMGGVIRLLPAKFGDTTYRQLALLAKGVSNGLGGQLGVKLEQHNEKSHFGHRLVLNIKRSGDARSASYILSNTGIAQLSGSYYGRLEKGNNQFSLSSSAFIQQIAILSASHIGNLTDLNRALQSDSPLIINPFTYEIASPYQYIQHLTNKLKWRHSSEKLGELNLSYTIQNNVRQEFDSHNGGSSAALHLNLWTHQLNASVEKHKGDYKIQYGVMAEQ